MARSTTLRQEIMKWYTIRRFDGGLNNAFADHMLLDNQASAILNYDLTTRGSIKVRNGYTRLNVSALVPSAGAMSATSAPIRGLTRFYNTSATNPWVACCSGRIHYGTATLSSYLATSVSVGSDMEFEVFRDTLLMFNGVDSYMTKLRAATDISAWSNAPLTRIVQSWQDRLWCVPIASAYAIRHTSAVGSLSAWSAADYFMVGRQDGGDIIALEVFQGNLIILKTTGIYVLIGSAPENYQLELMSRHGCISRRSVVVGDTGIIYLAPDGVRMFDGINSILLSETEKYKVKIIDDINMNAVNNVAATYFDRKYILCYDNVAATTTRNNYAFVYNFLTGSWTKYTLDSNVFFKTLGSNEDEDLYFGSSVSGYVYKMFNGTTDDNPAAIAAARTTSAVAISAKYKTKGFDFSSQYKDLGASDKQFRKVIVKGAIASSFIGVSAQIDSGRGLTRQWHIDSEATGGFLLGTGVLGQTSLAMRIGNLDKEQSLPTNAQGKTISIVIESKRKSQQNEINMISFGFREKRVRG